jgi:CheY-like chemotaxis protein
MTTDDSRPTSAGDSTAHPRAAPASFDNILDAADRVAARQPGVGASAPTVVAPRRVLVIDDHHDTAESLAVLLAADGHDARAVRSAFTAFDALAGFDPEVCLIDLRMPLMDGFETAARLRTILGPRVRLLAITGELAAAADPRAAAFERVFAKPLDVDELLRAVAAGPPH